MSVGSIHAVQGELGIVLAAVACAAFVTVTEPVTIPLPRRVAAIDLPGARPGERDGLTCGP